MSLFSRCLATPRRQMATVALVAFLPASGSYAQTVNPAAPGAATVQSLPARYNVISLGANASVDGLNGKRSLNDKGQVAGTLKINDTTTHAFLYDGTAVKDLGTLGGNSSYGAAINASGQVAGSADLANGSSHAFLFDGTTMKDLGTLKGGYSSGSAINDRGQVAGASDDTGFLYDGTTMKDIGNLGAGAPGVMDMNNNGQVTGWARTAKSFDPFLGYAQWSNAFLYDGTTMKEFNTLSDVRSYGRAINDRGQVAGWYFSPTGSDHAFIYDGTAMKDIGATRLGTSVGYAINASGQVTGEVTEEPPVPYDGCCVRVAFIYNGTTMKELGTLGGHGSYGTAINGQGQIVGSAATASGANHAFIWTATDGMVDLNTRLSNAPAGLELHTAVAISDSGHILAYANSGLVLLTPASSNGGNGGANPGQPSNPSGTGNSGSNSNPGQPSTPPANGNNGNGSTPTQPSPPPNTGNGRGNSSTPTQPAIPALPVSVTASTPVILNMSAGNGPAVMPSVVSQLSGVLGTQLSVVGQSAAGAVVLQGINGTKLAFAPIGFQAGDGRANGVYPAGNGKYVVVAGGNALTITPAVVALDQLTGLLPGATIAVTDKGTITGNVGGTAYSVQPDVFVTSNQGASASIITTTTVNGTTVQREVAVASSSGPASIALGTDGVPRFTDTNGNTQKLNPAFADSTAVQDGARSLDANANATVNLDGTITLILNGQRLTLVPDLTLQGIPADKAGQAFWQEGPNRYRLRNDAPVGTSQGFSVK